MRIEIVVSRVEYERAVDFEERLNVLIRFFDEAKVHFSDSCLGGFEGCNEFGVPHQTFPVVVASLVAGGGFACVFAR